TGIMRNICGLHRKDFFLMRYSMPSTAFKPRRLAAALALGTLFLAPAAPVPAQINLPVLGDSISGTISTEQEYRFGREFLRSVRRQSKIMDDPLIAEYIASLTYKLAATSELTDHRLSFVLIDSEVLNAFAAPGGVVGVNA